LIVDSGGFALGAYTVGGEEAMVMNSMSWMFLFMTIVGYASIPFISGWIVSASGVSSIGKKMVSTTMMAGKL